MPPDLPPAHFTAGQAEEKEAPEGARDEVPQVMDHPFRTAALGGFHRQDVLDFLEKTANENSQRQQQMQQKIAELEEQCRQLTEKSDGQEARIAHLEREREELNDRLEGRERELEDSRRALDGESRRRRELEKELDGVRQEREQMEQRLAGAEHDAAAYAAIKDRSAGVELQAHCRAQTVLDQANRQAQQIRDQADQWLQRVEQDYTGLRSRMGTSITHAQQELRRAEEAMSQITRLMEEQSRGVETIRRANLPKQQEGGKREPSKPE